MAIILPNSVFLHIPKTGGTWVTQALINAGLVEEYASTHATMSSVKRHYVTGNREWFLFVRNPVTWYQSRWSSQFHRRRYRKGIAPLTYEASLSRMGLDAINRRQMRDFRAWMRHALRLTRGMGWVTHLYGTYLEGVRYVGRTEFLLRDLTRILERVEETFDGRALATTPPVNTATRHDRYYTRELLEEVIDREGETIRRFGYSDDWRDYGEFLEK